MLTRRNTAAFSTVRTQEHADDAGDDFPVPSPSSHDVPPCTIPVPYDIRVPLAW
jgi:hypothetical protein